MVELEAVDELRVKSPLRTPPVNRRYLRSLSARDSGSSIAAKLAGLKLIRFVPVGGGYDDMSFSDLETNICEVV